MDVPVSEAKGRLTDLVRRAEAGETVTLTRRGMPVARIASVRDRPPPSAILTLIASVQAEAASVAQPMQVDLFDAQGLPC